MNMQEQLLKQGYRYRPGGSYNKTSITIHSTGNPSSTAQNERGWLDNPSNDRDASWHYVVGEDVVIQAIPDNEMAWHCGDTEGNRHSIGIELIESGNREKVLETAAEFVAVKLREYNWTIACVKQHYDWTKKNCPRILIDKKCIKDEMDWNYFMGRVHYFMERKIEMEKEKRYQTVAELPEWAKPTIQKLVNEGKIADRNKLDLSMDMIRMLTIIPLVSAITMICMRME